MWKFLLEYDKVEKFAEDACQDNMEITVVKSEMKNIPIKENISKVTELKQL